jgi:threonine/homoserine/homoserine lactone efflux protein
VNGVVGDLLPLAVGVAISPVPIIAAILMLLSSRAGATSGGFLLGWVAGIVAATTLFLILTSGAGTDDAGGPSTTVSWLKIVLGGVLVLLALRTWRGRPHTGEAGEMPAWMASIDALSLGKAIGLGFVLAAVNPKNLILCAAAGAVVGAGGLDGGQQVSAVVIFTILAASTVAVPVIGYAFAKDRLAAPLAELKSWLQANNAVVMAVLLLVLGAVLIGKGVSAL